MSLLSDTDIEQILSPSSHSGFRETMQPGNWEGFQDNLLIFPFSDELITPVGYDLTIGDLYLSFAKQEKLALEPGDELVIQPLDTVLITTEEYLGLPKNQTIAGLIESKVSLVCKGLSNISTTLDHDWEGHLLVSVTNYRNNPITLKRGQPFCTAMFFSSRNPATRPCGKPAGRRDVIVDQLDGWLIEAKQAAEQSKFALLSSILPTMVPVVIMLAIAGIGLMLFGPTEGFAGSVALGIATASSLLPTIRLFRQRTTGRSDKSPPSRK